MKHQLDLVTALEWVLKKQMAFSLFSMQLWIFGYQNWTSTCILNNLPNFQTKMKFGSCPKDLHCVSTWIFLLFCPEPPNQNIVKNSAQCTYLVKSVLKYHSFYVLRWYIEEKNQNLYIFVNFRLCSNLEVPKPPIQTNFGGLSGASLAPE